MPKKGFHRWTPNKCAEIVLDFCVWSAANGGLRDGGLSKSEDSRGKRPFSSDILWISQVLFGPSGKRQKKGREKAKKADFGRFPGRAAR